jgi:DNA-binding XRE family transcriptional regulator
MELKTTRPDSSGEIARRFKKLGRRSHLVQRQLAELIGICRRAVSDIERRRVMPHLSTWNQFADLEARHEEARQLSGCLLRPFWR